MFSFIAQFSLTWLLVLILATVANAGIYVVRPSAGSTCRGGQDCQLQWLDDGTSPLLSAIGSCTVGLYFGSQQLVQPLGTVDVSGRRSFTFQVNPQAGPNSDKYYIALVSESLKVNGTSATAWSPFFRLIRSAIAFFSFLPDNASHSGLFHRRLHSFHLNSRVIGHSHIFRISKRTVLVKRHPFRFNLINLIYHCDTFVFSHLTCINSPFSVTFDLHHPR
ncbi:hypothetical protein ONZ45_g7411 [Pleurotus djamor]|nr:hypothetical protein ONZ45_g7411 [Pleurotus djamor]